MGVYESCSKMKKSIREMDEVWSRTREVWKDEKSREFEEQFLEQLSIAIKRTEYSLAGISALLNEVRAEFKR